jgi:hypothetical protein
MTCLEVQDLLAGFVAQALPETARSPVSAHVAACSSCQDAARRVRIAWEFLEGLEFPPPPLDLGERLKTVILPPLSAPVRAPPPPPFWHRLQRPVLVTAGVASVVMGLWVGGTVAYGVWPRRASDLSSGPAPVPSPLPARPVLTPWSHSGKGVLQLVAVPGAEVWAASDSQGMLDESGGRLHLVEGTVWGHPFPGERLRLDVAGWPVTVTRGRFTAEGFGAVASLTCHEGFLRIDLEPEPLAVPEGTVVLLIPGKPPLGPRPARALYPGRP